MREYELPLERKPVPKQLEDTGKYTYVVEETASQHIARRIEQRTLHALEKTDVKVQRALQSVFDMANEYLGAPIGIKDTFANHDERRAYRHTLTGDSKLFVEEQRIRAGAALTIFAYIESLPYFVGAHSHIFKDIAEQAKHFQEANSSRYAAETYDSLPFEKKTALAQQTSKELLSMLRQLSVLIRTNRAKLVTSE